MIKSNKDYLRNKGIAPIAAIIIGLIIGVAIVVGIVTQKKAPVSEELIFVPTEEPEPFSEELAEEEEEQAPQFASECGLIITSPLPNQAISFPLTITGVVDNTDSILRCTWRRHEGEAGNVKVFDANGNQVSDIVFIMPIEWMTSDPTSFTIIIPSLTGTPTTSDLTLIFTETNDPAGFQGNDTLTIPVSLSTSPQALESPCLPSDPPSITEISPNGGEVYHAGDSILVTWTSCNISASQEMIIYAIRPGPGSAVDESPSFIVTPFSLNDGQEIIDIPVGFVPNSNGVYDDEFKMYVGTNVITGPGQYQNYQDLSDTVFNILP